MNILGVLWTWIVAHPIECIALAVYVLANVLPRPKPAELTGWRATLWGTIDRLCVLTAGRLPGFWKALFAATPADEPPPADPPRTEP